MLVRATEQSRGSRSIRVAPLYVKDVVPFMSEHMELGVRWGAKLSQELDTTDFGILCMTLDNTVTHGCFSRPGV